MNKILFFLLLPFIGVSQVTKVSNLNMYYPFDFKYSGKTPQGDSTWDGRLSQSFTDSLKNAVATNNTQAAQITSLSSQGASNTAAITSLTADLKRATDRIAALEALAPGLPVPVNVSTSTYTLTLNDNGKTIQVANACTVNIPPMAAGVKCWVVRKGGRVSFTGNFSKRANFTPLASIDQKVEIHYDTATKATIY